MKALFFSVALAVSILAMAQSPDMNQLEALLGQQQMDQKMGSQEPILLVCAPTDGNSVCDDRIDHPCCDDQSVCSTDGKSHYGFCD